MYIIKNYTYELNDKKFEFFRYTFNDLPKMIESIRLYSELVIDRFRHGQWWKLEITELDGTSVTFDGDIHLKVEFELLNEEDISTDSEFTVKRFTNSNKTYQYLKVLKGKELTFAEEGDWDDDSVNDLIEYLKPSTSTKSRLIINMKLGLSKKMNMDWYNFEYSIYRTFTIEEIEKMTESEVDNLKRLATNIQEGLY